MVSETRKEKLIKLVEEHERIHQNKIIAIGEKNGIGSHETIRKGLIELSSPEDGRLIEERTNEKGEQNYSFYSLPELTDREKGLVKRFEDLQYVLNSYCRVLIEKNFDFTNERKEFRKTHNVFSDEFYKKQFVKSMYLFILKNKMLMEKIYVQLPEKGYSKIIRNGKKMFDELDKSIFEPFLIREFLFLFSFCPKYILTHNKNNVL